MRLNLQQLFQILADIEREYKCAPEEVTYCLNKETIRSLVGIDFPFNQFVQLILSVWLQKPHPQMKEEVEKVLVYKIHRKNLEQDQ